MRSELEPPAVAAARLATRQHGVIARRQLLEIGFRPGAITGALAAARLHPLHRGVYAVGHRNIAPRGRMMAAVLACGPSALLSHRSAALLWQIASTSRSRVDVTVVRSPRRRPEIDVHSVRGIDDRDRTAVDGIPVTTVARTLLDLAAVMRHAQVERAIEEAERGRILDVRSLDDLIARSPGRHATCVLRAILEEQRDAPHTKQELERLFVDVCRQYALPPPLINGTVIGYEVDAHWPHAKLVVELDSWRFHGTRRAFERDRERDLRLQLEGWRVVRVTWRRLTRGPNTVVGELRRLLAV